MKINNYDQSGFLSPNSVKFVRSDDTPASRKDVTISRKLAGYNSSTKVYSIPEYRMAFRRDAVLDGLPTGQRLTFDLVIRTPIGTETTDFDAAFGDLQSVMTDPAFKDAVIRQLFPEACCEEN